MTHQSIDAIGIFCTKCHRRLRVPIAGLTSATFKGTLNLKCECGGGAVVKGGTSE